VDVDEPFAAWLSAVVAGLAALPWDEVVAAPAAAPAPVVAAAPVVVTAPVAFAGPPPRPDAPLGSRRNPATFTVLENHAATGPGASREVRHLRLDRGAGALDYAAGDSLALWAPNDPSVVDAILASLDRPGGFQTLNVGSGAPIRLDALVDAIERAVGRPVLRHHLPDQPGDVPRTHADVRRAAAALGWAPRVQMEEGLRRTAAAMRAAR
jgi:nucleoside-diphosphate-sugar epimerase